MFLSAYLVLLPAVTFYVIISTIIPVADYHMYIV